MQFSSKSFGLYIGAYRLSPFAAGFYIALIWGPLLWSKSCAIFFKDRSLKSIGFPIVRAKQLISKIAFITIIFYTLKKRECRYSLCIKLKCDFTFYYIDNADTCRTPEGVEI